LNKPSFGLLEEKGGWLGHPIGGGLVNETNACHGICLREQAFTFGDNKIKQNKKSLSDFTRF
jgi:hypothetical protein